MLHRHSVSKWIRILIAAGLLVAGGAGVISAWNTGRAQERYFRYKYGHMEGTRYAVLPVDFSKPNPEYERLPELLEACRVAQAKDSRNYYFPSYVSQQALIAALVSTNEVDFRRAFGAAEYWNKIAFALNPYDIEICYIRCRILWEKGDHNAAIAFWRDVVMAREFWNPDLRSHYISLLKRSGNYSLARKEAVYLKNRSEARALDKLQQKRTASME